jgi:hypothetical protein
VWQAVLTAKRRRSGGARPASASEGVKVPLLFGRFRSAHMVRVGHHGLMAGPEKIVNGLLGCSLDQVEI